MPSIICAGKAATAGVSALLLSELDLKSTAVPFGRIIIDEGLGLDVGIVWREGSVGWLSCGEGIVAGN